MILVISSLVNREFVVGRVGSSMKVTEDMYKEYQEAKKTEIVIWCDGRPKQERHYKKEIFF